MKRGHWRSRWSLVGPAALGVFIIVLPRLISSQWVYGPLLARLRAENFHLRVEDVSLRWLTPIKLRGVSLEQDDRPGKNLLSIREINASKGLLGFLLSRRELGQWKLVEPVVDIELIQDGSNLKDLINAIKGQPNATDEADSGGPKSTPQLNVALLVRQASVIVRRNDLTSPVVVVPPLDVDLAYASAGGSTTLEIGPTRWLDHVKLTPELMQIGLEFALPTLAKSAWLDGEISLDSGAIKIPLDQPANSIGDCQIKFHRVRAGVEEPAMIAVLGMLAKLAGRQSDGEVFLVDGTQVVVVVGDGYVTHSGTKFGLPKVDPRLQLASAGRVGLVDRSLDLTIQLPVPLEWLARNEDVKSIGVPMVSLPVTGTLDDPVVQWVAMREESAELLARIRLLLGDESPAKAAMVGALEGIASGRGDDAIRATADLLGTLRDLRTRRLEADSGGQVAASDSPTPETAADTPSRIPLRERLRRRLNP